MGGSDRVANALANSVGSDETSGDNLRTKLKALADHDEAKAAGQLPTLAGAVKKQYGEVKGKFAEVQSKKGAYTGPDKEALYKAVEAAWKAFNELYNYYKFDRYAIDGGHERRRFKEAIEYDVSGNGLGSRLKDKAEELRGAAKALENKATSESVGSLTTPARDLATNANNLASGDTSNNATSVIEKYNTLETAYDTAGANQSKVSKEFKAVKHLYDRMLNVSKAGKLKDQVGNGSDNRILHKAKLLHGAANLLATAGQVSGNPALKDPVDALKKAIGESESVPGLQQALKDLSGANANNLKELITKAKEVIEKYNDVKSAYEAVEAQKSAYNAALSASVPNETEKYDQVETYFGQLEGAYNAGKCKDITPIFDKPWIG